MYKINEIRFSLDEREKGTYISSEEGLPAIHHVASDAVASAIRCATAEMAVLAVENHRLTYTMEVSANGSVAGPDKKFHTVVINSVDDWDLGVDIITVRAYDVVEITDIHNELKLRSRGVDEKGKAPLSEISGILALLEKINPDALRLICMRVRNTGRDQLELVLQCAYCASQDGLSDERAPDVVIGRYSLNEELRIREDMKSIFIGLHSSHPLLSCGECMHE